eukprot:5262088-Prymnesium_polylepis.1
MPSVAILMPIDRTLSERKQKSAPTTSLLVRGQSEGHDRAVGAVCKEQERPLQLWRCAESKRGICRASVCLGPCWRTSPGCPTGPRWWSPCP